MMGTHGPECEGFQNIHTNISHNATDEMLTMAEDLAMNQIAWLPSKIYLHIKNILNEKYEMWYGATDKKVMNRIRNTRHEMRDSDIF